MDAKLDILKVHFNMCNTQKWVELSVAHWHLILPKTFILQKITVNFCMNIYTEILEGNSRR